MIIIIRNQVGSEERAQLMTLLCRLTGNQRPLMPTMLEGCEIITLDGSSLDEQARAILTQQAAVERLISIKTPYKLVSRAFKPQDSRVVVGDALGGRPVTIG